MRRVTAVLMTGGRCGSSMLMGMLQRSGVDVGAVTKTTSPQNEKGVFEIIELQRWWMEILSPIKFMSFMAPVPDYDKARLICHQHMKENTRMIDKYFGGDHIAIKCHFAIPVMLFDPAVFSVQTIYQTRSLPAMAQSCQKWNSKPGDFKTWLMAWHKFVTRYFHIDLQMAFADWTRSPIAAYAKLETKIKLPSIATDDEINGWFDHKLIHFK